MKRTYLSNLPSSLNFEWRVVLLLVENWIPIPRLWDVKYRLICQFLKVFLQTKNNSRVQDIQWISPVCILEFNTRNKSMIYMLLFVNNWCSIMYCRLQPGLVRVKYKRRNDKIKFIYSQKATNYLTGST